VGDETQSVRRGATFKMNITLEVVKFLCLGISRAKNDGFLCGRELQCLCLPTGRRYELQYVQYYITATKPL
jgi:hypothetical protein